MDPIVMPDISMPEWSMEVKRLENGAYVVHVLRKNESSDSHSFIFAAEVFETMARKVMLGVDVRSIFVRE